MKHYFKKKGRADEEWCVFHIVICQSRTAVNTNPVVFTEEHCTARGRRNLEISHRFNDRIKTKSAFNTCILIISVRMSEAKTHSFWSKREHYLLGRLSVHMGEVQMCASRWFASHFYTSFSHRRYLERVYLERTIRFKTHSLPWTFRGSTSSSKRASKKITEDCI